jgi:protein required for attachment to host cells
MKKWIMVANRVHAQVFHGQTFELIEKLENPIGREKNHALTTDKPGWSRGKFAQPSSIHALTGEKDPHEEAAIQFARKLARFIDKAFIMHRFDTLTLVAEPKLLGHIRASLSKHLLKQIDCVEKDFPHANRHDIGTALGFDMRALAIKQHAQGSSRDATE